MRTEGIGGIFTFKHQNITSPVRSYFIALGLCKNPTRKRDSARLHLVTIVIGSLVSHQKNSRSDDDAFLYACMYVYVLDEFRHGF
jgi:hypothetical protein